MPVQVKGRVQVQAEDKWQETAIQECGGRAAERQQGVVRAVAKSRTWAATSAQWLVAALECKARAARAPGVLERNRKSGF